jgi:hypothetical protein
MGASINYVAAIFVERGFSEDGLAEHKRFVEGNLLSEMMPQWYSKQGSYADKNKERPDHNLLACVAAHSFGPT